MRLSPRLASVRVSPELWPAAERTTKARLDSDHMPHPTDYQQLLCSVNAQTRGYYIESCQFIS